MYEASKTRNIRGPDFADRYFKGRVIDIGSGKDLVVPWAEPFDRPHGDASKVSTIRPRGSYDCVHSSHCLEHMEDPVAALADWWSLVRPGGYLVTVVPDEELYEQGMWPSLFNWDHKWAFTMSAPRAEHILDVVELHRRLPGAELVDSCRHDASYDHAMLASSKDHDFKAWVGYCNFIEQARRFGAGRFMPELRMWSWWARRGVPIDQTLADAMAQIQVIVRKLD
ncbi:MAG TPA: methyltransferase domain-containing protein [Usitatibacter sp.]|nr:methyltransferase domain-containing protein [Usitatibacter sp.]